MTAKDRRSKTVDERARKRGTSATFLLFIDRSDILRHLVFGRTTKSCHSVLHLGCGNTPILGAQIGGLGGTSRPVVDKTKTSPRFLYQIAHIIFDGASVVGRTLASSLDAVNARKFLDIRPSLTISAPQSLQAHAPHYWPVGEPAMHM